MIKLKLNESRNYLKKKKMVEEGNENLVNNHKNFFKVLENVENKDLFMKYYFNNQKMGVSGRKLFGKKLLKNVKILDAEHFLNNLEKINLVVDVGKVIELNKNKELYGKKIKKSIENIINFEIKNIAKKIFNNKDTSYIILMKGDRKVEINKNIIFVNVDNEVYYDVKEYYKLEFKKKKSKFIKKRRIEKFII